jgi:hypothetical protein
MRRSHIEAQRIVFMALLTVFMAFTARNVIRASSLRAVDVEITLPTGAKPHVLIPEGQGAILPLPDRRQFGFVAVIRDNATPSVVVVTIWEVRAKSTKKLADVVAELGGPAVVSGTTPSFAIRILRITSVSSPSLENNSSQLLTLCRSPSRRPVTLAQ